MTPLVKELTVAAPVEKAWAVFTDEISSWWPSETHSIEPERVSEIVFEARPGGRIVERWDDGTEFSWGEVDLCEPPHRVRFSWHPQKEPGAATEVEVTFTATGNGTNVRLEHRGWERLGERAAGARADYDPGWDFVLGRYTARL